MINDITEHSSVGKIPDGIERGRIDAAEAAKLLGFAKHDIPILIRAGMLVPLGKPAKSAPKYFATAQILGLVKNRGFLDAATKAVQDYWRAKNFRKKQKS